MVSTCDIHTHTHAHDAGRASMESKNVMRRRVWCGWSGMTCNERVREPLSLRVLALAALWKATIARTHWHSGLLVPFVCSILGAVYIK